MKLKEIKIERNTKETKVTVAVCEVQNTKIKTGIGFLDHMLTAFSTHSGIGFDISCSGDLEVDCHHTAEDVGIVMGKAFGELWQQEKRKRYGYAMIPMDEALCNAAVDLSNRPFLVFGGEFTADKIGNLDAQMIKEFFRAFAFNAQITLHINILYGENDHHKAEAVFKATAYAIEQAMRPAQELLSTKGVL